MPYVWQSETASPLGRTQVELTRIMLEFWSNFAASGDPNGAALPSWPPYEAQDSPRIGLLAGGQTQRITAHEYAQDHHCAFWDAL